MVHDEPAVGTETPGSEVGAVAVAGQDEQVGAFGGSDNLPLDPPGSLQPGAGTSQLLGGGLEKLLSGFASQVLQADAGVAFAVAAAKQPGVCAVRGTGDVMAGDVEQHDVRALGRMCAGGFHAGTDDEAVRARWAVEPVGRRRRQAATGSAGSHASGQPAPVDRAGATDHPLTVEQRTRTRQGRQQ